MKEIDYGTFVSLAQSTFPSPIPLMKLNDLYQPISEALLKAGGRPYNVIPIPYLYKAFVGRIEGSRQADAKQTAAAQSELVNLLQRYLR